MLRYYCVNQLASHFEMYYSVNDKNHSRNKTTYLRGKNNIQIMHSFVVCFNIFYAQKKKVVVISLSLPFIYHQIYYCRPWPDFEGRCGEVRTPEIFLHLP